METVEESDAFQQVILSVGTVGITAHTLMLLAVLAVLIAAFFFVAIRAYHTYLRFRFYRDYKIELRRSIRIHHRRKKGPNSFSLAFPVWLFPNRDGSRDRRRANNEIKRGTCSLLVDSYRIACESPIHLVWLVNKLRASGVSIDRCYEEERKYRAILRRSTMLQERDTILSLIDRFHEKPTEFESYCARIFELHGFRAVVTPPSRDGGYDIELWKNVSLVGIVECKCYDPDNKVGRDLVQKLVGANATLGAARMIFVTTSDFSFEAKEYARNAGVELVDGGGLLRMAQAYASGGTRTPAVEEYKLVREDLTKHYPPDYPPERFEV